jgi:hypothetical protein
MNNFSTKHFIAVWLWSALILGVQSCSDRSVQLEKSKVQFTLSPGTTSHGRVKDMELPENARLRISIESSSGTPVFSNHEIEVLKAGDSYMTDALELMPGAYSITDFMIVNDSEVVYAAPKSESPLSTYVLHSLPYSFSVAENSVANVDMQVIDVRDEKPEAYGYASFKVNIVNTLSLTVFKKKGGQTSLTEATAELRRGKELIKTFSLAAAMNTISFEGNPDTVYTLSVYSSEEANVKTFNLKDLKKELGAKPLKVTLEPALLLTIDSYVDEANEYEEYFEFLLDGTGGAVTINWGDGHEDAETLPFNGSHEYTSGNYTAIITGHLNQITNLSGFSYSTIISGIKGLTNLTALKTYDPSWGAVPIKVDLSNCKKLETIYIEKYGWPLDPIDLRTDFKLPAEHFINEFVFYVPSLDINRDNVTTAELEVFVNNIYNNATQRNIYDGKFFVSPVEAPSPAAQAKLDYLQNTFNWDIRLNKDIYEDSEGGRVKRDLNTRRENWLRHKFPNSVQAARSARMALIN